MSFRAADSESSEWTSSQISFTTFALFDCRWPMKCHRNVVAVDRVLRQQVLRAVLADDLDARLGEDPELLDGDVLRRRDDGDALAGPLTDPEIALPDLHGRQRHDAASSSSCCRSFAPGSSTTTSSSRASVAPSSGPSS